jgi:glutamyl-tRNA synthetase
LIANFSLERVTDAPGNYDAKKLFWLQGEYMKRVPTEDKVERCVPFLRKARLIGEKLDDATREKLTKIIDAAGDRIKLFSDVLAFATPLLRDEIEYDAKAMEKAFKKPGAKELLAEFADVLKGLSPFDAPSTDRALHDFAAAKGLKPGDVVQPVRVAVTGSLVGFGLFETLAILGKKKSLARIATVH